MFQIPKIEFQNGAFRLQVVAQSIPFGSLVFICGPNGSGKSTLLKGLSNILSASLPKEALYLSSQFYPQEGLCGKDLLDLYEVHTSPFLDLGLLEEFKIESLMLHPLESLSSGERQKIYLACALFHKNPVIALDEPLNFLDLSYFKILKKYLLKYLSQGRIFFISNHDLNWSLSFKDSQTWVVFQNQIGLQGQTSEVLSDVRLKNAFAIDTKILTLDNQRFLIVE